ncbi:MAG: L-aspartate oxidase [Syntrophorhabdus sp. PtaU1.Bin058]|nr:MAG: L-aspartate oxidase [Syntrophorhabdus sp. PtaU1.Bin058]
MGKRVVVIGAGLAGMIAACMAQREGAEVLLVDRGSIGLGSNSAMANGVVGRPSGKQDEKKYIADTIEIGRGLNRRSMIEIAAAEAENAISFLRSVGVNGTEGTNMYSVKSPDPEIIPGVTLVKKVREAVGALENVRCITGFYVTEIVTDRDHTRGIRGFDKTGKETEIPADAVVIATGGAGAVYLKNDNQKDIVGQGYRLAAQAGLALWDMEFVQYFPLVFADPHLPSMLVFPPYHKAIKLTNNSGEDIVAKYGLGDINEAAVKKRDAFSAILFGELQSGPVWMDFRDIPSEMWKKHPLSLLAKLKHDFSARPAAVSPAAHFFMGGVRTDEKGETDLPGLFACGEVVFGFHGANRRGGNALLECVVFGTIAGRNAAQYALGNDVSSMKEGGAAPTGMSAGRGDLRALRQEIREIAWNHAGVVRNEAGLKEGLEKIAGLRRRLGAILPQTTKELRLKLDLDSAAFAAQAIMTASLARKESRGSFLRSDFPYEDNANWKKNSCLRYDAENRAFTLSFGDVE